MYLGTQGKVKKRQALRKGKPDYCLPESCSISSNILHTLFRRETYYIILRHIQEQLDSMFQRTSFDIISFASDSPLLHLVPRYRPRTLTIHQTILPHICIIFQTHCRSLRTLAYYIAHSVQRPLCP